MIFEGRKPSELSPSDIRSILGHREDIELDFKQITYSQSGKDEDAWKLALLKDIASLLNASGGYLFVGVAETKSKCANSFINTNNAESEAQRMYEICKNYIKEMLVEDELVIEPYAVDENTKIIIVRVLTGGNKPYMIDYNHNTLFYMRCDNGQEGYNREMSVKEIRDAFLKDKVLRELEIIHKKVDDIRQKIGGSNE